MDKAQLTALEEKKILIGHYPYMMQALAVAANRVPAWRLSKDGKPCSLLDVFSFAKKYDATHPRKEDSRDFFMVSFEGAIGYSETGVEYMTSWIFVPMEPGKERDALVQKAMEEYNQAEAELAAAKKAAEEPAKRFCPHCGALIKNPNAKFCGSCGQPL